MNAMGRFAAAAAVVAAIVLGSCGEAGAHILLTNPYQISGPTGFSTASAPHATAIADNYSWSTNTACIVFAFGTATYAAGLDTGFSIAQGAPTVTLCLQMNTGQWTAGITNGQLLSSGTLTGTNLTAAIAVYTGAFTNLRDNADYFAMGTFLPGTQQALWGAGDL